MTDSVSRYYESMGRGKGAPYIDEKLNYAQTEPDLTEAVNKNIDEQIKDSQQFFADNIKLFNDSIKVRDQAFKDLASLTKSGIQLNKQYQKFKDNRNYLQNIDNQANDERYVTKWNAAKIDFQKEESAIDKDFEIEIAKATDSIEKTGSYTFDGPDGEVTITSDNLGSWKSSLLLSKGLTGSNAAKEANILAPAFWEIAKRDLLHSGTGLRFDELTDPDDKREWLEEAAAHFLGYVRESNPRISDGDIIDHILPNLKQVLSKELGVDGLVNNSAANQEVSNNTQYGRATTIMGVINNSKSNNLGFDSLFDSKTGMIKNIAASYEARGYTPKDATKQALVEFEDAVEFAYKNLGMTDDDYYYLMNEHKFGHSDGRTNVSFSEMGGIWTETQLSLDKKLSDINRERDTVALNGRFTELKERYDDNDTLISTEELQEFIGTDLFEQVARFKQLTDATAITGTDSDKDTIAKITNDIEVYAGNNFPKNITPLTLERNKNYIKIAANQDYFRLVKELEEGNVDSAKARADAYIKVSDKIEKGLYDENIPKDEVEYDPGKILIKNTEDISADKDAWINSKDYNIGELKYALQAQQQLKFGGDIPILYVNLEKYYPDLDARGLMVARLKAMNLIGNEYDNFLLPLKGKVDSISARNLTHFPTDAKTYQTILSSSKNFTGITESLLDRPISKNIQANGGEDAIFTVSQPGIEGGYENANLSTMNVGQLYEDMLAGNTNDILDDKRYGIYGIRGDNLKILLEYMLTNNIPIADRNFDRTFQDELMMLNLALESQKKLTLNGDVSYLNMLPISADESKSYEKLFKGIEDVDDDENIWNEVRYLLKGAAQYKINMDLYGPDKKEEE
tara:strand:- start:3746 stop:6310 length:2565 start_codon:yes stop_codon:yes gene_type:complete